MESYQNLLKSYSCLLESYQNRWKSYSNYNIFNDEGSTPLHVCIKNGDTTILKEFLKNGAKIDLNNKNGNTLLEYACQLKDPNLITFLVIHGSSPKKHIFFRDDNKDCKMSNNDIDLSKTDKLLKIILYAAIFEMMFKHTIPKKVIIKEYLEASEHFLEKIQIGYLNAILDKISKELRKGE